MDYTYIRHVPSPPLDAYIDYLYYQNSFRYSHEKMLPMKSLHLLVSFGDAIKVFDAFRAKPVAVLTESWVIGTWNVCHVADWPLDMQFFGVCFKPGKAYPFLQLPLSELHNQFVPLDVIWGHYDAEIREQLYTAPTIQAGFTLLERRLLARLGEAPHGLGVVQYAIGEIARHHGVVSIRTLSEHIGISQNHLNTHFKRMVGTSPKEIARLYRFESVLNSIDPTQPVDWTLIARRFRYYDLSHLNKDFEAFIGHSPTDYLRLRRQMWTENPEHDRLLRTLPID